MGHIKDNYEQKKLKKGFPGLSKKKKYRNELKRLSLFGEFLISEDRGHEIVTGSFR